MDESESVVTGTDVVNVVVPAPPPSADVAVSDEPFDDGDADDWVSEVSDGVIEVSEVGSGPVGMKVVVDPSLVTVDHQSSAVSWGFRGAILAIIILKGI